MVVSSIAYSTLWSASQGRRANCAQPIAREAILPLLQSLLVQGTNLIEQTLLVHQLQHGGADARAAGHDPYPDQSGILSVTLAHRHERRRKRRPVTSNTSRARIMRRSSFPRQPTPVDLRQAGMQNTNTPRYVPAPPGARHPHPCRGNSNLSRAATHTGRNHPPESGSGHGHESAQSAHGYALKLRHGRLIPHVHNVQQMVLNAAHPPT